MYKNEFDNALRQNKIYKSYLFYGQSIYLIERYAITIAKLLAQDDDIEKIYFEEYDFKDARNKLLQSSLFSNKNILLIKTDKKIPKKELDLLIEASNTNPNSYLIIAALGDADFKTMETSFSEKTKSAAVRFFQPSDQEAINFLNFEAKNLNLKYQDNALSHLYFMHKTDLALCVNDLKKLAILNEEITINTVDSNCFGMISINFEDFLHNLLSGADISDDLSLILDEGANEIYILNQIVAFVQQLFMISSYARSFGQANPKEILGYIPPKNIWEKKSKLAINRKPKEFEDILSYLLNLELELKSGKIDNVNLYLQASLRKFIVLFR